MNNYLRFFMNKIVYIQCESHFACDKIAMQSCNEWISQKLGKDERVNCYYLHEFIFLYKISFIIS